MNAKEYLNQIKLYDIRIRQLSEEVARLEAIANSTTGGMNPDKVQTSPDKSKREKAITKMVDLKNKLYTMMAEQEAVRIEVIDMIHQLTDSRYVELMYLKYVKGLRLIDIADVMKKSDGTEYSVDHINRLHGQALNAFREIYASTNQ